MWDTTILDLPGEVRKAAGMAQWYPTSREKRARYGAPGFPGQEKLRNKGAVCLMLLLAPSLAAQTATQTALSSALRNTPAIGLVVDVKTGMHLASVKPTGATIHRSAPGSILKPLFLASALEHQQILPQTTVFCRRDLRITDGGREWSLPCTHPQNNVAFTAQEALAYSCNRYFAALADRIPPAQASAILEHYGLPQTHTAQSREQEELVVLGLAGVLVSPVQVAEAYRKLALELDAPQAPAALDAVRQGLKDSVRFGMAHNAALPAMEIAGKTGTVTGAGWFAGIASLAREKVVLVIYLPRGNGADAARLAQHFFRTLAPPTPESARSLTVGVWATRSVTHLTATPLGNPNTPLQVEWQQDGLRTSSRKPVKQLSLRGHFRLQTSGEKEVVAAGSWTIAWQREGMRVLLTLPSENYVVAALNGEAAPDEPMASLKAMAISMRTFALENANRHRGEGFGLCDSTHCQALRLGQARPEVERAVRETAGETLWSGSQRAHVYYTQHCGGIGESATAVWPTEQASYLAGHKADPYCLRRSPAEWHTQIALTRLSAIFHAQGWQTPSPIQDVRISRRSATGRAQLLLVTGGGEPAQLSASSFRFAVDRALGWNQLRSDWYSTAVSGAALDIQGKGYGHGVGLCQAGAYEMAAEGHSAAEILTFYFPGTVAGVTPAGDGWQKSAGAGWTLLTTDSAAPLLREGNAAWVRAQALIAAPPGFPGPTVQELPSTELFRQTTGEPGWMLASTRGSNVFLQPAAVRQNDGGDETLLLHEFLHVLVEQQAGKNAPLWLREGFVETLASPGKQPFGSIDLAPSQVDAALAKPANAIVSRRAHLLAARMAALLCARYGVPAVKEFLRKGVPSEAVKSLGS
jgi:stage II sporulation protein D